MINIPPPVAMTEKRQSTLDKAFSVKAKRPKAAYDVEARFEADLLKPLLNKFKDLRDDFAFQFFEEYMEIRFQDRVGVGFVIFHLDKSPGMINYSWRENVIVFVSSHTIFNVFKLAQKGQLARLRCSKNGDDMQVKFTGVSSDPEDRVNQHCSLIVNQILSEGSGHEQDIVIPAGTGFCSVVMRSRNLFDNLRTLATLKMESVKLTSNGPAFTMGVEKDAGNDVALKLKTRLEEGAYEVESDLPLSAQYSVRWMQNFGDYGALFEYTELTLYENGLLRYRFTLPAGSLTVFLQQRVPD